MISCCAIRSYTYGFCTAPRRSLLRSLFCSASHLHPFNCKSLLFLITPSRLIVLFPLAPQSRAGLPPIIAIVESIPFKSGLSSFPLLAKGPHSCSRIKLQTNYNHTRSFRNPRYHEPSTNRNPTPIDSHRQEALIIFQQWRETREELSGVRRISIRAGWASRPHRLYVASPSFNPVRCARVALHRKLSGVLDSFLKS